MRGELFYRYFIKQRLRPGFTDLIATFVLTLYSAGGVADNQESGETDVEYENATTLTTTYESFSGSLLPVAAENRSKQRQGVLALEINRFFPVQDYWFIGGQLNAEVERVDSAANGKVTNQQFLELEQLWASWSPANSWFSDFRIGRFAIEDKSHWWWDENVNGASFTFAPWGSSLSLTVASADESPSTVDRTTDEEEGSVFWGLAQLEHEFESAGVVNFYYAHKTDNSEHYSAGQQVSETSFDENDDQLNWFGIGFENNWSIGSAGALNLRLDTAWMHGYSLGAELDEVEDTLVEDSDENENALPDAESLVNIGSTARTNLSGWGYNLLLTWSPGFRQVSSIELGYASGARDFRQTGLHSNDIDHAAYGEIFDPELTNVGIFTARISLPLFHSVDLHLQYNHYRREVLINEEIEANTEFETVAGERNIGCEIDLVLDYRISERISASFTAARFKAAEGIASGLDRQLDYLKAELDYAF